MVNAPIPPSADILAYIDAHWQVDTVRGIVTSRGREIGSPSERGYIRLTITIGSKPKTMKRSHIVWWKAKGEWPKQELDHENNVRDDDRIDNLRLANRPLQVENQSWRKSENYGSPWLTK